MKYLLTYHLFESFTHLGSKTITEEEFDQLQKKHCKNWTRAKTSLYRGQPYKIHGDYAYFDPKQGQGRTSIEPVNLHIELLSNLPSWKDYPKYSHCVVGVSGADPTAVGYGHCYEVVPFDGIKIAISPESDIWNSFANEEDGWGGDIDMVRNFLDSLDIDSDFWDQFGGGTIETKLKDIESLPNISDSPDMKLPIEYDILKGVSKFTGKEFNKITGRDCFDFINNYLFNPQERGFQVVNYEPGFEVPKNKQIWTEGPVLLISKHLV